MMNSVMLDQDSNYQAANMIRQQQFLKSLVQKLDCSPNQILSDLEEVNEFHVHIVHTVNTHHIIIIRFATT